MNLSNENIRLTIDKARSLLPQEKNISPAFRMVVDLLLVMLETLCERRDLNSKNSSKPPSSDPNREKVQRKKSNKKPGAQPGRIGKRLEAVSDPDYVQTIKIDRRTLPKGGYTEAGFEARQVIDYKIVRKVTEYQAEILIDSQGNRYIAKFPEHVKSAVQYGEAVKSTSVYLSQYQFLPYIRVTDYFENHANLRISVGSVFNFNKEAYKRLEQFEFERISKTQLINSLLNHTDETGINVNGKLIWLHTVCNEKWTYFLPHSKRGVEATEEADILPHFKGVLCHDHWKPYYHYTDCTHSLCNAHHLRELEHAKENDGQKWAGQMQRYLIKLNKIVDYSGGALNKTQQNKAREIYRKILEKAQIECPEPKKPKEKKRGRIKKSKSRNLLERLIKFEDDVLLFMTIDFVPFTNNAGENEIRMTKVQQKISGCFRSYEGALMFCRIRAYIITCRKHGIGATEALKALFRGNLRIF